MMDFTSTKLRPPIRLHIALADLDFSWYPLIDLARHGKIQRRRLGIYGGELCD